MIGPDDTWLIEDTDREMIIIGEFGKSNHERMSGDLRASATMYCTGTAGGRNAPTVFLMGGKNRMSGFQMSILLNQGLL